MILDGASTVTAVEVLYRKTYEFLLYTLSDALMSEYKLGSRPNCRIQPAIIGTDTDLYAPVLFVKISPGRYISSAGNLYVFNDKTREFQRCGSLEPTTDKWTDSELSVYDNEGNCYGEAIRLITNNFCPILGTDKLVVNVRQYILDYMGVYGLDPNDDTDFNLDDPKVVSFSETVCSDYYDLVLQSFLNLHIHEGVQYGAL